MKPRAPLKRRTGLRRTGLARRDMVEFRAGQRNGKAEALRRFVARERGLGRLVVVIGGGLPRRTGFVLKPGQHFDTDHSVPPSIGIVKRLSVAKSGALKMDLRLTEAAKRLGWRQRGKSLACVSKDRAKRARVRLRQYGDPAYLAWLHAQPCQLAGAKTAGVLCRTYYERSGIEAAHIRPRGAGHGAEVDGRSNLLSLCPGHHDWQGLRTVARVQREAGVDLWALAARQQAEYSAFPVPRPPRRL